MTEENKAGVLTNKWNAWMTGAGLAATIAVGTTLIGNAPTDHDTAVFFGENDFAVGVDRNGSVQAYNDLNLESFQEKCIESENCKDYADITKSMKSFLEQTGYPNIATAYEIEIATLDKNQQEAARAYDEGVEPVISDHAEGWNEFRENYEVYNRIHMNFEDLPVKIATEVQLADKALTGNATLYRSPVDSL